MLCEECQQQQSTVFLTEVRDGHGTTKHFCESCAAPFIQSLYQEIAQSGAAGNGPFPDDSIYEQLASADQRFTIDAFRFVTRAVFAASTTSGATIGHHVSGRDVAEAFRLLALSELGTAALPTLHGWGVRSTDDIGTLVFRMIEFGVLGARPEDAPEDFHSVYEFASAFPIVA
jgi:uncharacterized repeat protein (TIGR04138 family)